MGKSFDSLASFLPISLAYCASKFFKRIILSRLLFFLESNFTFSPRQAGFCSGGSKPNEIFYLPRSITEKFNKLRPGSRTILSTIDFSKAFDSGIPPFSINSFQLAFPLALLVGLNLSFLIGALAWFIKITKVILFESVEVFRKDPFLALYVSLFS